MERPLIDLELSDGPELPARKVSAEVFQPILERLQETARAGGTLVLEPDAERDRLLADYRRRFTEQVVHDASYNLQKLWQWASEIDAWGAPASRVFGDGQIRDGFGRLDRLRRELINTDCWAGDDHENDSGAAFQQFYVDALQLGDRLRRLQGGQRPRFRREKKLRRCDIPSAASYRVVQALFNAIDVAVPGVAHLRPLRSLLPAVCYIAMRSALPWPAYRVHEYERKLHVILASGALGSLNPGAGEVVRLRGVDEFFRDPQFFDPRTGQTRHNIILAFSHRQSVYDIAILAEALRGVDHGVWSNPRYFPESLKSDPRSVIVEPEGRKALRALRGKSASILQDARIPLVIFAAGNIPYLPYGQQMRVRRGIRLLVDHLTKITAGGRRRTYVVPVTFDDTVTFIRGLDPHITGTVHQPICTDDIHWERTADRRGQINRGDPLLNYLECLFLANTGQVRHGWRTPQVVETIRRVHLSLKLGHTLRDRFRRTVHPSIFDLSVEPS